MHRLALPLLPLVGLTLMAAQAVPARIIVSQIHRVFAPGALALARNDTLEIVNDDGELTHHAYAEGSGFTFDTGEQLPGSHATVTFSQPGTYTVLCRIHPRMKLEVTVK